MVGRDHKKLQECRHELASIDAQQWEQIASWGRRWKDWVRVNLPQVAEEFERAIRPPQPSRIADRMGMGPGVPWQMRNFDHLHAEAAQKDAEANTTGRQRWKKRLLDMLDGWERAYFGEDRVEAFAKVMTCAGHLVDDTKTFSTLYLAQQLRSRLSVPAIVRMTGRGATLRAYYNVLSELFTSATALSSEELKHAAYHVGCFLAAIEENMKDLQEALGFPLQDQSVSGTYNQTCKAYNDVLNEHDKLRSKMGLSAIYFERALVFSELPKWSDLNARTYSIGEQYDLYNDVKKLVSGAGKEVLVVEPYPDETLFDLYLEKLPASVQVRVLVQAGRYKPAFLQVAKMFVAKRANVEIREVARGDIHDRTFFVDDRAWVIGQSLKDAAKDKPTYRVEIALPAWRRDHEDLWNGGAKIA